MNWRPILDRVRSNLGPERLQLDSVLDDIVEALELAEAMPWRPIAEAPKDGTPVMAASLGPWPSVNSSGISPRVVRWSSWPREPWTKKDWRDDSGRPLKVTHFMATPPPTN